MSQERSVKDVSGLYILNMAERGGIRTPDTLLGCNCLAGSPVRPLQHLSAVSQGDSVYVTCAQFSIDPATW